MHKIIAESAARAAAGPDALERELDRMMEADFCRHAYVTSDILMPVVENFFCPWLSGVLRVPRPGGTHPSRPGHPRLTLSRSA